MRGDELGQARGETPAGPPAPEPTWIGVGAAGVFLAIGLFGCLATGVAAAAASEDEAVMIAMLGVPLGLAGLVAPIAAALTRRQAPAVAVGAPIGCGCATITFGIVAMVVFFTAIWPSL
ncbi:MAG: hypothetical protein U0234_14340 [Sandaracinus sp.]